MADGRHFENL